MTATALPSTGITVTDRGGNNLVFERDENGQVTSWSLDCRDRETRSVRFTDTDRRLVAAFLLEGLR